ncbi:hypothetical protein [Zavarzinella formosa]|uniref:hypothetical protein n=1 Tax=Zavarzinella formosa TaxID=360055 RepID=UPI000301F930|nr:hypothetical protein [Zavarzinella formosa]
MTFDLARPRYTLPLGDKTHELIGTMEMIEAVEYALKKGASEITVEVVNGMPSHELARLLAAILTACGEKTTPARMADLLWTEIGIAGAANTTLRMHLYAFLGICLAPPLDREKRAGEMGELLGKLGGASPGKATKKRA